MPSCPVASLSPALASSQEIQRKHFPDEFDEREARRAARADWEKDCKVPTKGEVDGSVCVYMWGHGGEGLLYRDPAAHHKSAFAP